MKIRLLSTRSRNKTSHEGTSPGQGPCRARAALQMAKNLGKRWHTNLNLELLGALGDCIQVLCGRHEVDFAFLRCRWFAGQHLLPDPRRVLSESSSLIISRKLPGQARQHNRLCHSTRGAGGKSPWLRGQSHHGCLAAHEERTAGARSCLTSKRSAGRSAR